MLTRWAAAPAALAALAGCGPGASEPADRAAAGGREPAAAVPVRVAAVERRSVASYLETNGTLEAENDVDVVARITGPIVELAVEEGAFVRKGGLLARIDPSEPRAQLEIAEVTAREAERSYERAEASYQAELISQADYDQALAQKESAEAVLHQRRVQFAYTRVTAPFDAMVVERTVKLGDNVSVNQKLFRVSDFDPLLCPIQVPEKELSRLRRGQPAYLTVEAWRGERFPARVLRIRPVVDAATGTIQVTLAVEGRDRLRPGMFASVHLETDRRESALTIPKSALSRESLGDTVYVAAGGMAARRPVTLGYEEALVVEVVSGLEEDDRVIVVGQDGLSEGTPIRIVEGPGSEAPAAGGSERRPAPRRGASSAPPPADRR